MTTLQEILQQYGGSAGTTVGGVPTNPTATGLYYRDQDIWIDGYRFVRCRFDNCRLHVKSGHFDLDHCVIDSTTRTIYHDPAMKVIRLYLNPYMPLNPEFAAWGPVRNEDGTISILGTT